MLKGDVRQPCNIRQAAGRAWHDQTHSTTPAMARQTRNIEVAHACNYVPVAIFAVSERSDLPKSPKSPIKSGSPESASESEPLLQVAGPHREDDDLGPYPCPAHGPIGRMTI